MYCCAREIASEPAGCGPIFTSCSTCLYARAPSKPPVVSGAGAAAIAPADGTAVPCAVAFDAAAAGTGAVECPHAKRHTKPAAAQTRRVAFIALRALFT